ncbi:GNAT family N-acetyltransferase [Polymorphobacter arshaanensis]|uniref:GNAT family N-acetyltransferase n=1 Tax=Glacieibacterium arshaanense TaxID=2511025 RepID=A0A4Y9ENJ0_9SPHN|nr:GNAT family N-acetyltransferase [Polymorphobacter arshaanensis]TFU03413.1 GNAT family N-acetyltransferase [Polymorphobacter arshaanensis]
MPAALKIRPYAAEDWDAICAVHDAARHDELRHSAGEAAYLPLADTYENEALFAARVDVGVADGEVAGFVAFSPAELTWLYVHPAHYGKGYGRALLRHAIAQAGPVIDTEVLVGNAPALALYLSEGFTVIEHSHGRLAGNEGFTASGLVLRRQRV